MILVKYTRNICQTYLHRRAYDDDFSAMSDINVIQYTVICIILKKLIKILLKWKKLYVSHVKSVELYNKIVVFHTQEIIFKIKILSKYFQDKPTYQFIVLNY